MDRARRRTCEAILELALDSSTTPEQTLLCTQLLDRAVSKKPRKACIGFDLSTWPDQTCVDYFRFHKIDIPVLAAALHLPEVVRVPRSRYSAPRVEALCIVLRHLAYPIRLMDLASLFGRIRKSATTRSCGCTSTGRGSFSLIRSGCPREQLTSQRQ